MRPVAQKSLNSGVHLTFRRRDSFDSSTHKSRRPHAIVLTLAGGIRPMPEADPGLAGRSDGVQVDRFLMRQVRRQRRDEEVEGDASNEQAEEAVRRFKTPVRRLAVSKQRLSRGKDLTDQQLLLPVPKCEDQTRSPSKAPSSLSHRSGRKTSRSCFSLVDRAAACPRRRVMSVSAGMETRSPSCRIKDVSRTAVDGRISSLVCGLEDSDIPAYLDVGCTGPSARASGPRASRLPGLKHML